MVTTNGFLFEHDKSNGLYPNGRNNNTLQENTSSFQAFCQRTGHPSTAEPTIEVPIVEHTGCTYTLGNEENLPIYIHESLIIDNGLIHDPSRNRLRVSQSLYNTWLQTARNEALHTERDRLWSIYTENIPLFWRHREEILADQRMFYAQTPFQVDTAYVSLAHSGPFHLGVLVRAWVDHEEIYTRTCLVCGGTLLIYSFAGSPLSGRSSHSAVCTDCGYRQLHVRDGIFASLATPIMRIAAQYTDLAPTVALSLEKVIEKFIRLNIAKV